MGEWNRLETLILPLLPCFRNTCFFPYRPTFCLFFIQTTGPFPVIKQEQLSPHSLSSQADSMSMQQASHDSATGRGR